MSKNDKELLDKIYDEMCMRIHGMNEQVNKLFVQVEKEFEIQRDSEIMFEFIENKEEDNNAKSD